MGLGTGALGGLYRPVRAPQARATIEAAWESGIRYFDTAPLYGYGLSERRLGKVLGRRPRESFTVSTKVGRLLRSSIPHHPTEFNDRGELFFKGVPRLSVVYGYSYAGALRSLDESLERLGSDHVDILLIHDPDAIQLGASPEEHLRAILQGAHRALCDLRTQGVVRAIGVGTNRVEMLIRFAQEADFDVFLVASRYTLLDQAAAQELLPLCFEKRIAVIAGGVYNSGILADPRAGATYDYVRAMPDLVERAQRIQAVCARHRVTLRAAAIQFPLAHPAVVSVLSGSRSRSELKENVRLFQLEIPDILWEEWIAEGLLPRDASVPNSKRLNLAARMGGKQR